MYSCVDLMKLFTVSDWSVFVQLTGLGPDELHVAELVGVEPGTLSRKATGTAEKMVSLSHVCIKHHTTALHFFL